MASKRNRFFQETKVNKLKSIVPKRLAGNKKFDQNGLASIVAVSILIVLVGLVSLGFARLMNRALQNSVGRQVATSADYVAQSAINDAIGYVRVKTERRPAEDPSASKCNSLLQNGHEFYEKIKDNFSEGSKYTCILIDPAPATLFYRVVDANKSHIVRLTTSQTVYLGKLLFSWQSVDRSLNNFASSGQKLEDEAKWGEAGYAPILRLTLYPVAPFDFSQPRTNSRTYFFYPNKGTSVTVINYAATPSSGRPQSINCDTTTRQIQPGDFKGVADYDCNVIISDLPFADSFYARITPLYAQADIKIKGNDRSPDPQVVEFTNQTLVDVTAKAGSAVKRLQARLDNTPRSGYNIAPSDDAFPEYALRTTNTLCKRLVVPSTGDVDIENGSKTNCPVKLE